MIRPVLLAVAHGSRSPAAAAVHNALVSRIRRADPAVEVVLSYVDHTAPSVTSALTDLSQAGRAAVVVPLLLSAAAHARGDIPAAIRAARGPVAPQRGDASGVGVLAGRSPSRFTYARVLGPHPLLLRALDRRLAEVGVPGHAAVVLAAAGSADPDANAEVVKTARLLWEWRRGANPGTSVGPVEAAFASATEPDVATTVARLRHLGHDTIAVASYFLAPGRLPDAVAASAAGLSVTAPLADSDEVAALVLARYTEAVAASAPAGCDTCVYRAPWPGHEHRVGAPQVVHLHPADATAGSSPDT